MRKNLPLASAHWMLPGQTNNMLVSFKFRGNTLTVLGKVVAGLVSWVENLDFDFNHSCSFFSIYETFSAFPHTNVLNASTIAIYHPEIRIYNKIFQLKGLASI